MKKCERKPCYNENCNHKKALHASLFGHSGSSVLSPNPSHVLGLEFSVCWACGVSGMSGLGVHPTQMTQSTLHNSPSTLRNKVNILSFSNYGVFLFFHGT